MWSLYQEDRFLEPLIFSNKKSQEDIVQEVLNSVKEGHKIIFIKGSCGTGKSAIALNIAKELGKTSIVVPIKNLQEQYKKDYEGSKYVLKNNNEKLKINVITGRKNHKCRFLEEEGASSLRKEINSTLNFEEDSRNFFSDSKIDYSADNSYLPCKIEIKEKNIHKLREYVKQNPNVNIKNFSKIKDIKRLSIAPACPYWCPLVPEDYEVGKGFGNAIKRKYRGLKGIDFVFYNRKIGCDFYQQFNSFIDSDVIIFNSRKYLLESYLNRKPQTEVEIIDECDEFLDSFSNQKTINIDRFQNALNYVNVSEEESEEVIHEIFMILNNLKSNARVQKAIISSDIIPLKETGIYDLFKLIAKNDHLVYDVDEDSYFMDIIEIAMEIGNFLEDAYIIFEKRESGLIANIAIINLEKKFQELLRKNKIFIMMSGTVHSEEVLKNIFGIDDFKVIDAETERQGEIEIFKTGFEKDCKYSNFSQGKLERGNYLIALDKCVELAKRPVLIHVNAFSDLPSEQEINQFSLKNLISKEKLIQEQEEDNSGKIVQNFKSGKTDILFSTRVSRGMDFPGEQCNSIIFTKYPNPNVQDAFWRVLNKTKPQHYWAFYRDKARRELLQKLYRGLRSKDDKIRVLSPDSRVLEYFEKKN